MLVKDARVQVKDIALKTKKSSMAIIYRIKQLVKKKVIKGYRAFIDFEKLGYQRYNIKFHLDDINIFDKLVNFCNMQPNIVKVDKSIGTFDFEFDMEIKDFEEFSEIIDKIKIQFPGVIRDYKYLRFLRYYKRNHLPL